MRDRASVEALKAAVPRAWHAVLAGFSAPTRVQLEVIPAVMKGGPVLVMAPTASGKTEAYIAPIAEKILDGSGSGNPSAWIVSPTRALVNDLTRRISPPMAAMGLRVGRRTGERREMSDADPPHMVVTTPESLDSMLTRKPALFFSARALVLDDVHILTDTPRGDQLACLVSRVRAISKDIQLIASSATVEDPEGVAGRYLGEGAGVLRVPGERPIAAEFIEGGRSGLSAALQRWTARADGIRKVLVFVRRRVDAERLFSMFKGRPPFGDAVFLHHGSLSRSGRETVERRMLTGTAGLCFATTTLEVGIDIGDIDLVVLAEPPPAVSSLLQRIGRGNRRTRTTRVGCMVRDAAQRLQYEHLIEAAGKGRLLGGSYHFCPSVLVQQCLGLLMQSPGKWISAKVLARRLPGWLNGTGWLCGLPELLDHLATQAWLVPAGRGRYATGERLEAAYESGRIHTHIDGGAGGVELVDQDTLRVIGSLPRHAADEGPMLLGGRRLRISKTLDHSKALVADTGGRADLKVAGRGPLTHGTLARDFARFIGLPPNTAPVVHMEDGTVALFHFLGDLRSALLGGLIQDRTGEKPMGGNAFCLLWKGLPNVFPLDIPVEAIQASAIRHRIKLLRRVLEGPWAKQMPPEWRTRHLLECLDMEAFQKTLKGMVIQDPAPSVQERVLVRLIFPLR